MKKQILLFVLLALRQLCIIAGAGDDCQQALEATEGVNTAPYAPHWYSYTMKGNGNKLVISSVGFTDTDTYLYVYDSCDGNLLASSDDYMNYQSEVKIFGLESGTTVFICWAGYFSSEGFDWSLSEEEALEGDDCSLAVPVTEGINIAPHAPYWCYYTMKSSGKKLVISSVGYTQTNTYLSVYDGCDGDLLALNCDYIDNQSKVNIFDLDSGTTAYIYWADYYSTEGFDWSLSEEEVIEGDVCSLAVPVTEGINTAPHAPYWYIYTKKDTGKKLVISSVGYTDTDTYLKVYDSCDGNELAANDDAHSSQSEVKIFDLDSGTTVYIYWSDNYSPEGFDWSITEEEVIEGDICSLAVPATEGVNTTPYASYWFSYTMKASNKKLVVSSVGLTDEDTYLYVYDACDGIMLAYNDDFSSYQSEVEVLYLDIGTTIYINWNDVFSSEGFDWSLSEEDDNGLAIPVPEEKNSTPSVTLLRNYPNPFASETTFEYELRSSAQVNLSVYNLQGLLVHTILDTEIPAGKYTVVWNGSHCESGIYYYRFEVYDSLGKVHMESGKLIITD